MAEELSEDRQKALQDKIDEQSRQLFGLLVKPNLTDDEKAAARGIIEKAPQILREEAFMAGFNMPDFASAYKPGVDITALIEQDANANKNVKQVLDNLKEIKVHDNNREKSAAQYVLDSAYLPNGELIGTQLAKNIHFLGTAVKDKEHQFFAEESKNDAARTAISKHLPEMTSLYSTAYKYPEGYGANPNRRNVSGQKVSDLMEHCIMISDMEDQHLSDVQNRSFMKNPEPATVKVNRGNETIENLEEAVYRGTATVEQKELLDKKKRDKKEAELENVDADKRQPFPEHEKGEDFKEGDIIDYMYKEWFLAGLSWIYDKVEEGAELLLSWGLSHFHDRSRNLKKAAQKANDGVLKEAFEKVSSFDNGVQGWRKNLLSGIDAQKAQIPTYVRKLNQDYAHLSPENEVELKQKYGSALIDSLKESYIRGGQSELNKSLKKVEMTKKIHLDRLQKVARIATDLTQFEMVDEMMRHDKKWRKKGRYKSDEVLLSPDEFGKRMQNRAGRIKDAVSAIEEDARLQAEAQISKMSREEKLQWVQDHILKPYDENIAVSDKIKEMGDKNQMIQNKEEFVRNLNHYAREGADTALLDTLIIETYASVKVDAFLTDQKSTAYEVNKLQETDITEGKFDVVGRSPNPNILALINGVDKECQGAVKEGIKHSQYFESENLNKRITARRGLYEEAKADSIPSVAESMMTLHQYHTADTQERKNNLPARQDRLNQAYEKIDMDRRVGKALAGIAAVGIMGQVGNQGHQM